MHNIFGPIEDVKFDGERLAIYNNMKQPLLIREDTGKGDGKSMIILYSSDSVKSMLQSAIKSAGKNTTSNSFISNYITKDVYANIFGNVGGDDPHNWRCITYEKIDSTDNPYSFAMKRFPDDPVVFVPAFITRHRTDESLLQIVSNTANGGN